MFLKKLTIFFILVLFVFSSSSCVRQKKGFKHFNTKDMKVALVVSGPLNDSSWNLAAYSGLKRFQNDYKANISVVEKVNLTDSETVFSRLAENKFDLVIGVGYEYGIVLEKIAKFYPNTFFCILGGEVSQADNLCSFGFKDEQYGYLVGVIAGLNTATNKVGIVVGKKLPAIERTITGMRHGLRTVNPKADLVVSYLNSWNDIIKGKEAGIAQINTGVDVITHLADNGGIGVVKAAEDADISAIGAIIDQYDLAPTTVIISVIQDASQLVYLAGEFYREGNLQPKIYRFGLKNQVIDLAQSRGNIESTIETRINRIKAELAENEIVSY